ncbi:MAG: hypothetical protein R3331_11090 [Sulfurospirillaceae bacterium]|nr:hypothetical protein [Sulfurospirillaceae bacterium]
MSFSNLIRKYFSNLFVSIVSKENSYIVFCKVIKNGKLKAKFEKEFDSSESVDTIDAKLEKYLISLQEEYNFTYISLLLDSMGQGAINGVEAEDFEKFSVDAKNIKSVKFKNWSAYASFIDINWAHKIYSNVGLDFIYSPFVLLYYMLSQHRPQKNVVLYMLNQQDSITLSIFKDGVLSFGVFAKMTEDTNLDEFNNIDDWEDEEEETNIVDDVDLLNTNNDDDIGEEFSALEDLTDLESDTQKIATETFLDVTEEVEDHISEEENPEYDNVEIDMSDIELYGRDMKIYKILNRTLREYYGNSIYESDFISKMIIFDGYDMSQEILQSIEHELLLTLETYKINVSEIVCDLSIKEANNEL